MIKPTLVVVAASVGLLGIAALAFAAKDRAAGKRTPTVIAAMTNLRGWLIDGTNTSVAKQTFQERADAVCVQGGPDVTVGTAASNSALERQAETDFAISHRPPGGR